MRSRYFTRSLIFLFAVLLAVAGLVAYGNSLASRLVPGDAGSGAYLVEDHAAPEQPAEDPDVDAKKVKTSGDENRITLLMVGDVLPHQRVWESGQREDGSRNYDHIFANTKKVISAADLAMVDQETPLGGDELGISGYPVFNSPQEIGTAEVGAGFDVILSATNHVVDQGQPGVRNTLDFWRGKHPEATVTGMFDSEEDFDTIRYFDIKGVRIAVLNYTYGTNGIPLPEENPWATAYLDDMDKVYADLAEAREKADLLVVCPHWGEEYMTEPTEYQRDWAQRFADAGVDIIFGNHPHIIEPVEVYKGKDGNETLVFFSTGNFVSSQLEMEKEIGCISQATVVKDEDGLRVESYSFTPVVCHHEYGTGYSTYLLKDYSQELAERNQDYPGTREQMNAFISAVLGEKYNAEKCVLEGGEVKICGERQAAELAQAA